MFLVRGRFRFGLGELSSGSGAQKDSHGRDMVLKKSRVEEIIKLTITLFKIVAIPFFCCIYNAVWNEICCSLDEFSMLIGDVKSKIIDLIVKDNRSIKARKMKAKNRMGLTLEWY